MTYKEAVQEIQRGGVVYANASFSDLIVDFKRCHFDKRGRVVCVAGVGEYELPVKGRFALYSSHQMEGERYL